MTEKQDVLARMPRTEAGRDMLAHSVQYVPADADKRITGAKIADIEDEAAALVRTPETLDAGTTTDCPLEGVHEHAFRGPHRFHEWDPSSYFTLNDRPPVRTPETLDVELEPSDYPRRQASPTSPEKLRLYAEYAVEHLADFAKPGTVFEDVRDVLHAGLAGKPLNIGTAVGARCPVCNALTDPRGEVEPHR